MNEELLNLITLKATSPKFRVFLSELIERRLAYEAIKARKNQISKELRAKREGITVQKIEKESKRLSADFVLRQDEKAKISDHKRKRVQAARDEAELLRMILASNQFELDQQERWMNSKGLAEENMPLYGELVSFLKESRNLIVAFAELNGWSSSPRK